MPTANELHRELVVLKKTTEPWLYSVSKCAPQKALKNLDVAFKNFFRRCKSKVAKKGFPKFKRRRHGIGSFTLTGTIKVTDRTIQLPRLGVLRLKEHGYFPITARIIAATVSERAGRWFVALRTDEIPVRRGGIETLGVDVGVKNLAVLSDGAVFENPKALKAAEGRLRRLHKSVSRKVKGSNNHRKAVARLAMQHYRISCVRKDSIHKTTDAITKRAAVLGIETLNVAGMIKNHRLAKAVSDASMAELHRQLCYKMAWSGGSVIKVDRWYPSSKTCSGCGTVKENLSLSERTFRCECGSEIDRDLNAAINLKNLAASSAATACGEESSGSACRVKLAFVKQEPNTAMASA